MTESEILLVGAGGHAHSCIEVVKSQGIFKVVGLVGRESEISERHFGHVVLGCDDDLPLLAKKWNHALVAIGQIQIGDLRKKLFSHLMSLGFKMPVIIASTACVSPHARLGQGSIVMHGAIINAGAVIGDNCIINTRSIVEHDTFVGNHCHVSTGAILNGNIRVGEGSFIGSGSVIKEGTVIGQNVLVGMHQSVRKSLADGVRFIGDVKS
jgi:sugar O-acyltransferase (sialic acid O-acetyltransferase NeuD family)